jgi:hypothetical protein
MTLAPYPSSRPAGVEQVSGPSPSVDTVQYATTRAELWRWYWKAWARPRGLWRFHVFIAAAIAATVTAIDRSATIDAGHVLIVFMIALLGCVALLPLWPQLRFKSAVRTLTIDDRGFSTDIGPISASRTWAEVRSIEQSGDAIVITGINNNAMTVPSRAFVSAMERLTFYEAAVRMKAHAENR